MANARKCDRCGKCFDPLRYGDKTMMARFQNPVFQNSEQIRNHDVGYYLIEDTADAYVDLCPDCTRDFEAFMEGNPLKMEEASFDKPDTVIDLDYCEAGSRYDRKPV